MEGKASEMRAAAEDGVSRVYDHGGLFGVDTATASLISSGRVMLGHACSCCQMGHRGDNHKMIIHSLSVSLCLCLSDFVCLSL